MASAKNKTAVSILACLALLIALLGSAGCQKNDGAASLPRGQGNAAVTAGRQVFVAQGCVNCHSVGGQGGKKGPDLTHVGARPGRTYDWLVQQVVNPKAHNPASRMPAFQGKINARGLMALGGYLTGLK